jgi:hypothetical protein
VEAYDGVVLVDSDDLLHASRVSEARAALQLNDLSGCALRLVDQQGQDLGSTFALPLQSGPEDVFPRNNVFGLSNSAFRSELLRKCLPIPSEVVLVDWFLATKAWLYGARMVFDPVVRMDYRQHGANMARVRPPFTQHQVIQDTERVRQHFRILLAAPKLDFIAERLAGLELVALDVETFYQNVILQPEQLDYYIQALNEMQPAPLWWSCVAYPSLRQIWVT